MEVQALREGRERRRRRREHDEQQAVSGTSASAGGASATDAQTHHDSARRKRRAEVEEELQQLLAAPAVSTPAASDGQPWRPPAAPVQEGAWRPPARSPDEAGPWHPPAAADGPWRPPTNAPQGSRSRSGRRRHRRRRRDGEDAAAENRSRSRPRKRARTEAPAETPSAPVEKSAAKASDPVTATKASAPAPAAGPPPSGPPPSGPPPGSFDKQEVPPSPSSHASAPPPLTEIESQLLGKIAAAVSKAAGITPPSESQSSVAAPPPHQVMLMPQAHPPYPGHPPPGHHPGYPMPHQAGPPPHPHGMPPMAPPMHMPPPGYGAPPPGYPPPPGAPHYQVYVPHPTHPGYYMAVPAHPHHPPPGHPYGYGPPPQDRRRTPSPEKGRGKGKDDKPPPPEKQGDGDNWEESRDQTRLKLLSDGCPDSPWTYPLKDESRRSFSGLLKGVLDEEQCKSFFDAIKEGTDWKQPEGQHGLIPRKTGWMVRRGCTCRYRYGGIEVEPQEFPKWMHELMTICMKPCGLTRPSDWPNSCNLNLYEDGGMTVGWHSDDEKLFQGKFRDCRIISLSLGAARKFELRLNWPEDGEKPVRRISLGSGDLLTMEGMTQKHFQHRVPREDNVTEPRINLTWRWVKKHVPRCPVGRPRGRDRDRDRGRDDD
mmetsp:Transcript_26447/g.47727  ORF Transcript_26447/g.47727 Transcript_26447/m.47727 type:complete len:653 (+) Transcript_26447:88-2046(+)